MAAAASGCRSQTQDAPIDLLRVLPSAERRAGSALDEAVHADTVTVAGVTRPALLMRAPSRVLWPVQLTANRAMLRTAVAVMDDHTGATTGVVVRVGISDSRSYNELLRLPVRVEPGSGPVWQPIDVDLSAYSGWRWSLFYQPYRLHWKLIFNADASRRGRVAWAEPTIELRR